MFGLLHSIRDSAWARYFIPLPASLLAWAGHIALMQGGANNAPFLPFFLAMVASSILGGVGPGLLTIAITEFLAGGFRNLFHAAAPMAMGTPIAATILAAVAIAAVLLADLSIRIALELKLTSKELQAVNETLEARIVERSAALLEAEENLRQAQKMEAVGLLTGGIAHDFNNLLTGIMGSLERLQTRLPHAPPEEMARYIAAARDAGARAANLTNRLLTFSRRQPLSPQGTDINRLIAGMAELIGRSIGPAITLEFHAPAGRQTCLIDPNQLEHALLNLCINASDAMPGGGTLAIATATVTLDAPRAAALGLDPGDYVTLTVRDTGTGMPPEILARAFDPFFTTKPVGQGTGLGLSMIYGFVRQSGGHVAVVSTPGAGTAVTLHLPRYDGEIIDPASPPAPAAIPASGGGEHILLVDDEPSIRLLAAEVLQEQGYVVHQAATAEAALRIMRQGVPIEILITDLGLPGLDGRGLAESCRASRPGLKILFITGYDEQNHSLPDAFPASILNKPFSMAALAQRIREMLGH